MKNNRKRAKREESESYLQRFSPTKRVIVTTILIFISLLFLMPVFIILMNSFKGRFFISDAPFQLPDAKTFVGIKNYTEGVIKTGLLTSFRWSLIITILSVVVIVLLCAMTAWYITRRKSKATGILYYLFVFSMIVPFQMVMFTMTKVSDILGLNNPFSIVVIYLGFGAGLSIFTFCGFVKSVPIEMEEAAMIDGCTPVQNFFKVVFPILKPTSITVAILNTMWIWNDYLLPSLVLKNEYKTIPIAVQSLKGGYGSIDMGAMMAMLVLAILPIIIFYLACQKYIIRGIAAGAVKG